MLRWNKVCLINTIHFTLQPYVRISEMASMSTRHNRLVGGGDSGRRSGFRSCPRSSKSLLLLRAGSQPARSGLLKAGRRVGEARKRRRSAGVLHAILLLARWLQPSLPICSQAQFCLARAPPRLHANTCLCPCSAMGYEKTNELRKIRCSRKSVTNSYHGLEAG